MPLHGRNIRWGGIDELFVNPMNEKLEKSSGIYYDKNVKETIAHKGVDLTKMVNRISTLLPVKVLGSFFYA